MSIIRKTIGPHRWGIGYHHWFFGLVRFDQLPAPAPEPELRPFNGTAHACLRLDGCLCGADTMELCKRPDHRCIG